MIEVELREITSEVLEDLRAHVVLPPEQVRYVGTVDGALDEAAQVPEANPWYRGVYADGVPVGFVMLGWDVEPVDGLVGPWFLWKLMVAPDSQGSGVGRAIVDRVARVVREHGGTELLTSYSEGPGDPSAFYAALGFVPTGRRHGDEILSALPVSSLVTSVAAGSVTLLLPRVLGPVEGSETLTGHTQDTDLGVLAALRSRHSVGSVSAGA